MQLGPDYPSGLDRKLTGNYRRKVCWNWGSNPQPASCEAQVFLNVNKRHNCRHLFIRVELSIPTELAVK